MKKRESALILGVVGLLMTCNPFAANAQVDPGTGSGSTGIGKFPVSVEKIRVNEVINADKIPQKAQIFKEGDQKAVPQKLTKESRFKDMKTLKESLKNFDLSDKDVVQLGDRAADVAQLAELKDLTKDQVKHLKESIANHKDSKVTSLPVENGRVIDGESTHPVSPAYYRTQAKESKSTDTSGIMSTDEKERLDKLGDGTGVHYVMNSTYNSWNKASMFIQFPWAYATTDFYFHYNDGTAQWEENDTPYLMFGKYTNYGGSDIGLFYSSNAGGWQVFCGGNQYNQKYIWLNSWSSEVIPTGSDVQLVVTELDDALRADVYYHNPSNGAWELHPQSTTFYWHSPGVVWYDMGYKYWGAGEFTREYSLAQTAVDYKSGAYMLGAHEYDVYLYSDTRNVNTVWNDSVSTKHQWDGITDHDRNGLLPVVDINYSLYTSYPYWNDQASISYQ